MNKLLNGLYLFLTALPKLVEWIASVKRDIKKKALKDALDKKDAATIEKLFKSIGDDTDKPVH